MVSTAVTELPTGLMWIPSVHKTSCGDLTPGPLADIIQHCSLLFDLRDFPVIHFCLREEKQCENLKRNKFKEVKLHHFLSPFVADAHFTASMEKIVME